jgi:rod shape-determining protein MreC
MRVLKLLLKRWWPLLVALGIAYGALRHPELALRLRAVLRGPAVEASKAPVQAARAAVQSLQAPDETEQMRQELAILRLEYAAVKERLDRLRLRGGRLAYPSGQRLARLTPAALLYRDPASWFKTAVLDVGREAGVRMDAGVLNAYGVVGRLVQVGPESSQLQLLSDPDCRFSARLPRSGLQCAVAGDGRRGAVLQYLGGQDDVRVGDLVETGRGSRSFPSGVPVGRVVRVARLDGGLRLLAEVEPAAPLNRLEGLYVWVGEPRP